MAAPVRKEAVPSPIQMQGAETKSVEGPPQPAPKASTVASGDVKPSLHPSEPAQGKHGKVCLGITPPPCTPVSFCYGEV